MTKLNVLEDRYWKDLDRIVMFGFGRQGKKMYSTLCKDFDIVAIIDNDMEKWGKRINGRTIVSFEQALSLLHQYKIIVTTSQHYYQIISKQLQTIGLRENIDYVMYQQFITEWYYKYKNKINVLKTDISLTSLCTLNCKKCMQFLPYWKSDRKKENSLEKIKNDIDIYFKCVDYLFDLDIVGGEPFLYRDLKDFIIYIGENYRTRIGYVGFITNGMIIPEDEVLELLHRYSINVSISDYSETVGYNYKIELLCAKLNEYQISYMRNRHIDWFDFGFPEERYYYEGEAAMSHMQCCNTICHTLDDKKLFYCGLEWSAQKGGLYPIEEKAYVDLEKIERGENDRSDILEMLIGNIEGGYMEFCKVCGGFGIDNNNHVETARQMKYQ